MSIEQHRWLGLSSLVFVAVVAGILQKAYVLNGDSHPTKEERATISDVSFVIFAIALVIILLSFTSKAREKYKSLIDSVLPFFLSVLFTSALFVQYSITREDFLSGNYSSAPMILGLAVMVTFIVLGINVFILTSDSIFISIASAVALVLTFAGVSDMIQSSRGVASEMSADKKANDWFWIFGLLVYMAMLLFFIMYFIMYFISHSGRSTQGGDIFGGGLTSVDALLTYFFLFMSAASIAMVPSYLYIGGSKSSALHLWVGNDIVDASSLLIYINMLFTLLATLIMLFVNSKSKQFSDKLDKIKERRDMIEQRLKALGVSAPSPSRTKSN